MKKPPRSLRPFATVAAALLALVACQNATDSNSNSDSSVVATASFPIAAPRVPDNATALIQNDTISNKLNCPPLGSDTSTTCKATLNLPHPLGADSLALQLWTLGVQTYTLYFKESGSSTKLDLGSHSVVSLDTLLLSGFANLPAVQKSAFGSGPTGLVAYYASLLLANDAAVVGKALPVGMSIDSVKKELVRVGVDSGKTLSELTSLSIQLGSVTLTLDTTTIRLDVSILIHAGVLSSSDSASLYPAYPVQVQTPISVSGPVVAGGSPVVVSGVFSWKAGKVVSPKFEVHTAKGVDTNFLFPITNSPSTSATTWNLANSVTLQAKTAASTGTDTLVATLSTDSGYFATSRTTFQVVGRDTTAPTLKILSPSSDTSVPNGTAGILIKAVATDSGSGLDSIAIGSVKSASSPCTTTVALAVGVDTITVQAWDNAGNKSTATVHVTRAKAPGDSAPPVLKITSPSKDTTVPYATTSLAVTASATDSGSGMGYVIIGSTKLTTSPYTATVSLGVGTDTIVVQALDNVGNKSTAVLHVTRSKDTTSPVITPGAGTTTRTVLFDTAKVQLGWAIQTSHGLASLSLNGIALAVTTTPSQAENLVLGPNPFVLVVTDSLGNTSRDSFMITRSPDVSGPAITWVAPSASLAVDATVSSYKIQVKATDLSGVDSVYLQGVKANNDSGSYWSSTISLPSPNGVPMKVVAKAWDKLKNLSVDSTSITITRNSPSGTDKPTLTLLQPSSNVGNTLSFTSDTLHVVYKITDLVALDTTKILFGTVVPKRLTDSTWAGDVPAPPTGQPTTITIQAANVNGVGSVDQIVVTRATDQVPPTIVRSAGTGSRTVVYDTTSVALSWTVSDNYKMGSITLNGAVVPLTSNVVATKPLAVGVNSFVLVATDSFGNTSKDSIAITRSANTTAPVVTHATGTGTQSVSYTTTSINLGWNISAKVGIASITLNGTPVTVASSISKSMPLSVGSNPFVLVVTDSSSNSTRDSFVVTRNPNSAAPTILRAAADTVKSVLYATNSVTLGWTLSSNAGIASVKLNGTTLTAAWTISSKDTLVVGTNTFVLVVTDSTNLTTRDSFVITRGGDVTPPVIVRNSGTVSQTLTNVTTTYTVSWTVTDDVKMGTVTISDTTVNPTGSGVYSLTVHLLVGTRKVGIVATDASGNKSTDTVVLVRSAPAPTHSLKSGTYIGTMYDTLKATASDSLKYSLNGGSTWLKYTTPIAVTSSTTIMAQNYPGPTVTSDTVGIRNVTKVSAGMDGSLFLIKDTLWAVGWNTDMAYLQTLAGQFGNGGAADVLTPSVIATGVSDVVSANGTTMILMTDGTVQVSGNNDGDHGDGSQISTQSFAPISGMTNVSQIGFFYNGEEGEILKKDGSLWAAGNSNVGNGTTGPVVNYTKILDNVQKITNGAALKVDGTVWVWGEFHPDTAASYSPFLVPTLVDSNTTNIFAGGNSSTGTLFSVKNDGTVLGRGDNSSSLIYFSDSNYVSLSHPVTLAYGIISAAIGSDFNFLLFSNGTVWANGTWTYYDPTLSSTPNQFMTGVTSISIGTDVRLGHTALFTKQDGSVWGYGWNTKNSLLAGTTDTAIARPTRINF